MEMALRIGHYILGETLGAGTFGKVKSKSDTCFKPIDCSRLAGFGRLKLDRSRVVCR